MKFKYVKIDFRNRHVDIDREKVKNALHVYYINTYVDKRLKVLSNSFKYSYFNMKNLKNIDDSIEALIQEILEACDNNGCKKIKAGA